MKTLKTLNSLIFMALFFCSFFTLGAQTQAPFTLEGGCSRLTVGGGPAIPNFNMYSAEVVFIASGGGNACNKSTINPSLVMQRKYQLYRKNNNGFSKAGTPLSKNQLNGLTLTHGTYKVTVLEPTPYQVCPDNINSYILVYDHFNNNRIGVQGYINSISIPGEVYIGKPTTGDNIYSLLDIAVAPNFYNPGDPVIIDMSNNKHYDRYRISIKQTSGNSGNWSSTGWVSGPVSQVDLLNEVWKRNQPGWVFWQGHTFEVRVATANSDCVGGWNMVAKEFEICTYANPCRIVEAEEKDITLSPNPTSNMFRLNNFTLNAEKNYQLVVYNYAGKQVMSTQDVVAKEFDVSDLSAGIYVVTILEDGNRIYTDRLSVVK